MLLYRCVNATITNYYTIDIAYYSYEKVTGPVLHFVSSAMDIMLSLTPDTVNIPKHINHSHWRD